QIRHLPRRMVPFWVVGELCAAMPGKIDEQGGADFTQWFHQGKEHFCGPQKPVKHHQRGQRGILVSQTVGGVFDAVEEMVFLVQLWFQSLLLRSMDAFGSVTHSTTRTPVPL